MKLWYLANARIPTEKAHGLQIVKMCEAFARLGIDVELLVPFRRQSEQMRQVGSVWDYYDVTTPFPIQRLRSPDFIPFERFVPPRFSWLLFALQSLIFGVMATLKTGRAQGVYYTRDWYALLALALMRRWHGNPIFFEAHEMHGASQKKLLCWLLRRINGLVVITQALKAHYEAFGVAAERILVAPDGIDERRLTPPISKEAARAQLDLPYDNTIICYAGHLFRWKGVYTLAEAMRHLPETYLLCIVGGMVEDRQALQRCIVERQLPRIMLVGHVPYQAVPQYLAAADVLALPNSAAASISRECTSPLKLFEYMAAQRPIVASDLPSLREILRDGENACLVPPDDSIALAEGVMRVMNDPALQTRLIAAAYADVQGYTWNKRAQQIITTIEHIIHAQ